MSENIQPASEENKIVEDFGKEKLSENSSVVNVEQSVPNLESLISKNEDVNKFFIGYIKENVLSLLSNNSDGTSDDIREEEEV